VVAKYLCEVYHSHASITSRNLGTLMKASVAVIEFPGSNGDHDMLHATRSVEGMDSRLVWHKKEALGDVDLVIIPGGFSYGDYLRSGAIAQFSPIMKDVIRFANQGGLVLGVCNGFQVLCEAGLLPGALMKNASLRFVCKPVRVRVENGDTPFTQGANRGDVLTIPIAHGEGNYYLAQDELDLLEERNQVVLRYVDKDGNATPEANPNGSVNNIAAVINEQGNVMGMMPHPERHVEELFGHAHGHVIFDSLKSALTSIPA